MRSVAQSAKRLWRNAERSRAILPIMASVLLTCTGSAMLTTAVSLRLGEPGVTASVVQLVLTAAIVALGRRRLVTPAARLARSA